MIRQKQLSALTMAVALMTPFPALSDLSGSNPFLDSPKSTDESMDAEAREKIEQLQRDMQSIRSKLSSINEPSSKPSQSPSEIDQLFKGVNNQNKNPSSASSILNSGDSQGSYESFMKINGKYLMKKVSGKGPLYKEVSYEKYRKNISGALDMKAPVAKPDQEDSNQ